MLHSFLDSLSDNSIFAVLAFVFVNLLVTLLARDFGDAEAYPDRLSDPSS